MTMSKAEVISRLEFWIEVLGQESTPANVEWEKFLHCVELSAQN